MYTAGTVHRYWFMYVYYRGYSQVLVHVCIIQGLFTGTGWFMYVCILQGLFTGTGSCMYHIGAVHRYFLTVSVTHGMSMLLGICTNLSVRYETPIPI